MPRSGSESVMRSRGASRSVSALLPLLAIAALLGAAGPGRAEPPTTPNVDVVYERPAPGPRRGLISVPARVVEGVAAMGVVGAAAFLVARARDRKRP